MVNGESQKNSEANNEIPFMKIALVSSAEIEAQLIISDKLRYIILTKKK